MKTRLSLSPARKLLRGGSFLACLALAVGLLACSGSGGGLNPTETPTAQTAADATSPLPAATTAAPAPVSSETPAPQPPTAPPAIQPTSPPQPTATTTPPTPPPPPPTTAPPPPQPAAVSLVLRASGIAFDKAQLTAPTGSRVAATLQNEDAGIPHSLQFQFPGAPAATPCTGPCTLPQTFTAPAPGTYQFVCTVHPEMTGRFVVMQ